MGCGLRLLTCFVFIVCVCALGLLCAARGGCFVIAVVGWVVGLVSVFGSCLCLLLIVLWFDVLTF